MFKKQVGYGDLVPTSKASKLFTAFYAFYASIVAAVALGELVTNHVKQAVRMLNRYFQGLRASTLSILLFVVIASVGVLWFMVVEDFDLVDAVYFSIVSLSSVGFGDVTVQSSASKIFLVPFLLIAIVWIGVLMSGFDEDETERRLDIVKVKRAVSSLVSRAEKKSKSGQLDEAEFLASIMIELNMVRESEISELRSMYRTFSRNGVVSLSSFKTT